MDAIYTGAEAMALEAIKQAWALVMAVAMPFGYVMLQRFFAKKAWGAGAASYAGKAYIDLVQARKDNPTAPLHSLITDVVAAQAQAFAVDYADTAKRAGATDVLASATSRVHGELGALLASDPTVSVAPVAQPLASVVGIRAS